MEIWLCPRISKWELLKCVPDLVSTLDLAATPMFALCPRDREASCAKIAQGHTHLIG